ncbi:MAG: hypothetical protein RR198_00330 [Oscillospiraceae bacterium]
MKIRTDNTGEIKQLRAMFKSNKGYSPFASTFILETANMGGRDKRKPPNSCRRFNF